MNASVVLLVVPTLCYLGVAVNEARRGNGPMAIVFAAYALANGGLLWQLMR